ncbi:MAG: lantibiotic dehydratase [Bacteroidota bacterium]
MTARAADPEYASSDFFVLRAPLLPFDDFERWGDGIGGPARASDDPGLEAVLRADRDLLRGRLRAIVALPEIRAALLVAAPHLEANLAVWERDPDGPRGARIEISLVRYITRIATRPTPFGLFAANTLGRLGPATRFALLPRRAARPRARLDMDYLDAIARALCADPAVRGRLRLHPNDTLHRSADRWRYAEARWEESGRAYHLVAAEASDYLDATLARAAAGATAADLAAPLAREAEVSPDEAEAFVAQLVESQILVPELVPTVTSSDAIGDLVEVLEARGTDGATGSALRRLSRSLDARNRQDAAGGAVAGPDDYRAIVAEVPALDREPDLPYALQVDLMRDAEQATLGPEVAAELLRAARLLHRVRPPRPLSALDSFRDEFLERYGGGEVAIAEALDPEAGIGFGGSVPDSAPLLEGLEIPDAEPDAARRRTVLLHSLLARTGSSHGAEAASLELEERDLAALETPRRPPLPDAFAVLATVAAESEAALDAGRFQVLVEYALGPSGARLLGRFCHADPALREAVEGHLRAEEALRPEAVFAEIVHMPEGRLGNVICRPPLRAYEIPFLGRSGAPAERQLPLSDLTVTVIEGRVALRSKRLGREVIPRLTSAHNYRFRSLRLYDFLCSLQGQGVSEMASWDWGALDTAPYLPRLTHGRIVLTRARWRVVREEIEPVARAEGAARLRSVRAWREARRIPRVALVAEEDNRLLVDFENPLSLDSFLHLSRSRPDTVLLERFPGPDELVARGPDGRYTHEIVVPFVRKSVPPETAAPGTSGEAGATRRDRSWPPRAIAVRRVFPPGSEWLYAKIYTGASGADQALRHIVAPLVERLAGDVPDLPWFFLRYADPSWHLRWRLKGEPAWLHDVVQPALEALVQPPMESRGVWRLAYDTYQREVERYGGELGIGLSERIFEADSRAALDLVSALTGDAGLEARGLLAIRGSDRVLEDFGFTPAERRRAFGRAREGLAARLGADKPFERKLDESYRKRRRAFEQLFDPDVTDDTDLSRALARLERRSEDVAPFAADLARLARQGSLAAPLESIALSHVHMHCNRLLRGAHAAQELVIYDALCRLHDSWKARGASRS